MLEVAERVRFVAAVSVSEMVNDIAGVKTSSSVVTAAIEEMVGVSLTAVTVSTKERLAVSAPSLTVTLILEVPVRFAAGTMCMFRLVPVPEKVMLLTGTSTMFVDVAVTVRLLLKVSISVR